MAVSYKKLWHILIDRSMKKLDLEMTAGITHYQMYKLAGIKDITTDVIEAICRALDVEIGDILEFVPDGSAAEESLDPEKRVYYTGDGEWLSHTTSCGNCLSTRR